MARPRLDRNGVGDGQEPDLTEVDNAGVSEGAGSVFESFAAEIPKDQPRLTPTESSPAPAAESPVKQVIFWSVDKELVLYYRAGFLNKSMGSATYTSTIAVKFEDHYARFDETPENAKTIAWMRAHESNGFKFKEVPDMSNVVELPSIKELRQMTMDQLKGLCSKNAVKHEGDATKETLILALLEGNR